MRLPPRQIAGSGPGNGFTHHFPGITKMVEAGYPGVPSGDHFADVGKMVRAKRSDD
jgi:hypothetical protein